MRARLEDAASWYVVLAKYEQENTALEHLAQQGFHTYMPLVFNGTSVRPLFTGYFFVRFRRSDRWQAIISTVGVKELLGSPTPLPRHVVTDIMNACIIKNGSLVLLPGASIHIASGQFAGSKALVKYSEKECITLLLRILGREVCVAFTREELEDVL